RPGSAGPPIEVAEVLRTRHAFCPVSNCVAFMMTVCGSPPVSETDGAAAVVVPLLVVVCEVGLCPQAASAAVSKSSTNRETCFLKTLVMFIDSLYPADHFRFVRVIGRHCYG